MIKKIFAFTTAFFLILSSIAFTGCERYTENSTSLPNPSQNSGGKGIELNDLIQREGFDLFDFALLPNGQLLLCYYNNGFCQFETYDISSKKTVTASEAFQFDRRGAGGIRVLTDNFYFVSYGAVYIFDFSCNLVKKTSLPENTASLGKPFFWISNDLSKAAYIKNPDNQGEFLYISNLDKSEEERICEIGAELTITELFFSLSNDFLGFDGVTIPSGKTESIDCYGYITLNDNKKTIIPDDKTFMTNVGDIMLIQDKTGERNSVRKGKVKLLDLKTKEKKEIVMRFPDECESAYLGINPDYLVGMHKDDSSRSLSFTIYKDGEMYSSAEYQCSTEQLYTDMSGVKIELDARAKQLLLFYFDTELSSYMIKIIKYTDK